MGENETTNEAKSRWGQRKERSVDRRCPTWTNCTEKRRKNEWDQAAQAIRSPVHRSPHQLPPHSTYVAVVHECLSYFCATAVIAKTTLPPAAGLAWPGWNETRLGGCFSWLDAPALRDLAGGPPPGFPAGPSHRLPWFGPQAYYASFPL